MSMTGGCLCGAIRYEVSADPMFQAICHCRDCQYVSGGAPANVILTPAAAITLTKGQTRVYWMEAESGARIGREFCENCGTPLFSELESQPQMKVIKVGGLDDPSAFAPALHIWTGSAQPWHRLNPDLPKFPKGPGGA